MKFKIDNIIYMSFFDKNHRFLWRMDAEKAEVNSEDLNYLETHSLKNPEIGDHIYLSVNVDKEKTVEIDGFLEGIYD